MRRVLLVVGVLVLLAGCIPPAPPSALPYVDGRVCAYPDECANLDYRPAQEQIVAEVMAGTNLACWHRIIGRESGWTTLARNPSGASGPLQIMRPLHDWRYVALGYDPGVMWADWRANLRVGRMMFDESGYSPWGGC